MICFDNGSVNRNDESHKNRVGELTKEVTHEEDKQTLIAIRYEKREESSSSTDRLKFAIDYAPS